jgi:hypothetical protein
MTLGGNPILKIVPNAIQFEQADALEKGDFRCARLLVCDRIRLLKWLLFDGAAEQLEKAKYAETDQSNRSWFELPSARTLHPAV